MSLSVNVTSRLYETDYTAWIQEQVGLLQAGAWDQLDIAHLVEEMESLGKQQRQELRNRLGVLLGHLLKWEFQENQRSKSWFSTIREQRRRIADLIEDNPSLKPSIAEIMEKAYQDGVDLAVRETLLDYGDFPSQCPYSMDQTLTGSFLPGEPLE